MKSFFHDPLKRDAILRALWEKAKTTSLARSPEFLARFKWLKSRLGNRRHAGKFLDPVILDIERASRLESIRVNNTPAFPKVERGKELFVGYSAKGYPVVLDYRVLDKATLIIGSPGAGKTNLIGILHQELRKKGITAEFFCHKGEGRRFPDVVVFRPDQEPGNPLEPIGNSEKYWAGWCQEFAKVSNLRTETWTELIAVLLRIERGLKSGEPYPSLKDFERVLFRLAKQDRRNKLITAAQALHSLNSILGKTAYIRRSPNLEGRYNTVVYEYQGLPPRIYTFLSGVRLLRAQMQATRCGRHGLWHAYLYDEGQDEFGREMSQVTGSGYFSPHKKAAKEARALGIGLIVGVQMIGEVDSCLTSTPGTVFCFRCQSPRDAQDAADLIGLSRDLVPVIQNLPVGTCFIHSIGFSRPEQIAVPKAPLHGYRSNTEVATEMAEELAWLEANTIFAPEITEESAPLVYSEILEESTSVETEPQKEKPEPASSFPPAETLFPDHKALLQSIRDSPSLSVAEHYKVCGFSAGKGNRIKSELIAWGFIFTETQKSSNGRPRILLRLARGAEGIQNQISRDNTSEK